MIMATNDILKSLGIESFSLSSASGLKKENIYRKDIFADCLTDREKKTKRRALRNILDNFISTILRSDKTNVKKRCEDFYKYYVAVYNVNDFSVNSICSNNTDEIKKSNIEKMLTIVKANISTNDKLATKKKATKKTETKTEIVTETKTETENK